MNNTENTILNLSLISEILDNNGYSSWCKQIVQATDLLRDRDAKIKELTGYINGFSKDAVPVVRCKDCACGDADPEGGVVCDGAWHEDNWFCADGKRSGVSQQTEEKKKIDAPVVSLEFTGQEMDMILKYMEISEAVTVQAAIMNAVSLALDYADDDVSI